MKKIPILILVCTFVFGAIALSANAAANPQPAKTVTTSRPLSELDIAREKVEAARARVNALQIRLAVMRQHANMLKRADSGYPEIKLKQSHKVVVSVKTVVVKDRAAMLFCIADHESHGKGFNYTSVSSGGKYRGAFQADSAFYLAYADHPLGPDGKWLYPTADVAPPAIQDDMAWRGYQARKLGPWPPSQGKC